MDTANVKDESPSNSLVAEIQNGETRVARLLAIWNGRFEQDPAWNEATVAIYVVLARRLLAASAPLVALEVADSGLERWPEDILLRQLKGLALARTCQEGPAREVLEAAWRDIKDRAGSEKIEVEETLGALARVYKDLGLSAGDQRTRHSMWTRASEYYLEAYRRTAGYWSGINVATLSLLLGDSARAEQMASEVREHCLARLSEIVPAEKADYWLHATLGEAALNLQRWDEAERHYREAGRIGRTRPGDLNSTRRQASLLLVHLQRDVDVLNDWLPLPRVVVFSGHLLDRPDRRPARFPSALCEPVKAAIKSWLEKQRGLIGFSSAACGADVLFQEALSELGGEPHVVLPYNSDEFVRDSVAIGTPQQNEEWVERHQGVTRRAAAVIQASSTRLYHEAMSYDFANQLLCGLAMVRAKALAADLIGLAVWDGQPGDGSGGTSSAVARWHNLNLPVFCVDLSAQPASDPLMLNVSEDPHPETPMETQRGISSPAAKDRIAALLFADAEGFSKLSDPEVPRFVTEFLGRVAELAERDNETIAVRETWGDGIFFAFRSVREAGNFALHLAELVNDTDWQALGFSHPLRIRIALHAGPVHFSINPITGRPLCSGTHVSRAARLEPKTPAGQVYASEAFAALSALERVEDFHCIYVKQLPWAKHYGTFPAYAIRRRSR